jgi:hypothetical protein
MVLLSEGLRIYEVVYNTKSEGKQNTNKIQKQNQIQKNMCPSRNLLKVQFSSTTFHQFLPGVHDGSWRA